MTLKDVQQVSLDILKEIHEFCVQNNIKYSLAYGTLIGAIRHKGFVPWDDDIDIVMPRPDFEKFFDLYNSANFEAKRPEDSYIAFGRVFDTKRTFADTLKPWCNQETGIWIDVFPLDGVEEDEQAFKSRVEKLKKNQFFLSYRRTVMRPLNYSHDMITKIKWIVKWFKSRGRSFEEALSNHQKIIRKIPYGQSKYYGDLGVLVYAYKERHKIETFQQVVEVEFEGNKFFAMNGYDEVLRAYYGDYMVLPPVEKRVPKQSSYIKFYWK